MVEKIFEADEMDLCEVSPNWDAETLLKNKKIFYLKDILSTLNLDPVKVKRRANELIKAGKSPWEIMGVRKMWTHWIVRMSIFAAYYQKHLRPKVKKIDPAWDGNMLLKQKGDFLLTSVCKSIPFSAHQLRYRAKTNPNSRKDYGIYKDQDLNAFVVEMETFSKWIKSIWSGDFS